MTNGGNWVAADAFSRVLLRFGSFWEGGRFRNELKLVSTFWDELKLGSTFGIHHAVQPPSTARFWPVMNEEASVRRKVTAPAISGA